MASGDREKWDHRYEHDGFHRSDSPREWVSRHERILPRSGRALDLAAGRGQNAVYLANLGLDVEALDISPVGLQQANDLASRRGVTLQTRVVDLQQEPEQIPADTYRVILCIRYLQRELAGRIAAGLQPGGLAIVELVTERTLERRDKPSPQFLAREGELRDWFPGLTTLDYEEAWDDDIHLNRLVAGRESASI